MAGTKKRTSLKTEKSVKKTVVKRVHQQKRATPLTEKIEKETVRVADGFLEIAARSSVSVKRKLGGKCLAMRGWRALKHRVQKRNAGKCA